MRRSLASRKLNAERLPWVTRVDPQSCDGIKWGTVAIKDLYEHGPRNNRLPARGVQPKSRCQKRATWKFKALKESMAHDGVYCWHHLISAGLSHDSAEQDRTAAWFAENGWADA